MVTILGAAYHTVIRFEPVTYTNGLPSRGEAERFSAWGNIQPLSPRDLQMLPEGERTSARAYFFSEARLITVLESPGRPADRIIDCNGPLWEVQDVEDWTHHTTGLPHFKYELTEVGSDEE